MNLEDIMLSEINRIQKDKKAHNVAYMWNLNKWNSHKQRVQWWFPGAGGGGTWKISKGTNFVIR